MAGVRYHHFESVGSTQDYARSLLDKGEATPFLVTASEQTQGHGRLGRIWISPRGNFFGSFVMRPAVEPARYSEYSFLTAVVLAGTILKFAKADVTLKWPNDVLLNERKCAGILIESHGLQNEFLIIGMGVNLRHAPPDGDVRTPAAALWPDATVHPAADQKFKLALMKNFENWHARYQAEGFEIVRNEWLAYAHHLNLPITVQTPTEALAGIFAGIDTHGNLLLTQGLATRKVTTADVAV